jgi:tripartite-type tricarboxylate transporter receptor subunit TctC
MVGEWLRLSFGQTVIIENVTGANGSIGVGPVARAAPMATTGSRPLMHVSNAAVYTLVRRAEGLRANRALSTIPSLIVARQSLPGTIRKVLLPG